MWNPSRLSVPALTFAFDANGVDVVAAIRGDITDRRREYLSTIV